MKVSIQTRLKSTAAMVTLTSALVLTSGNALANDDTEQAIAQHNWFAQIDSNNNGYISEREFVEAATQRAEERAKAMFARMDEHGTGEISADDFNAMVAKRGEWSAERREEMRERMRTLREDGHPRADKRRGDREPSEHRRSRQQQEG